MDDKRGSQSYLEKSPNDSNRLLLLHEWDRSDFEFFFISGASEYRHQLMLNWDLSILGFGCFPGVSANLSSPPRSNSLVLPRPSSSNFNPSWTKMGRKKNYSHVAIVEATTSPVYFDPRYLPITKDTNDVPIEFLK